ncbi:MAG: DUF3244 domain-containing protein [Bacteroides sp.]|nr:DUF3244 domain-containing protein [Bacteroides sp.]
MKCLLTIFCTLLFSISSWANEVNIKLIHVHERYKNDRSISIEPSASHDGNVIYLSSHIPLEELQVIIRNGAGEILSSEIISVSPQHPSIISMGNAESGLYILELNDGENEYQGYFEIDQ